MQLKALSHCRLGFGACPCCSDMHSDAEWTRVVPGQMQLSARLRPR